MDDIVFLVELDAEGAYVARARRASIVTGADRMEALRDQIRDAVGCHFDEGERPQRIRVYHVRSWGCAVIEGRESLTTQPAAADQLPDIVPLWTDRGPPYVAEPQRDRFERFAELMEVVEWLCPQWPIRGPDIDGGDYRM